jgi:hypothetical protein
MTVIKLSKIELTSYTRKYITHQSFYYGSKHKSGQYQWGSDIEYKMPSDSIINKEGKNSIGIS